MTVGDVVLINGGQITATLTAGHKARAERHLRTIQEQGCWTLQAAAPVQIPSEFAGRVDTEARIVFPPTFFGAELNEVEEGGWEFDRDEEVAASGVSQAHAREIMVESDEEVNMEDL